LTSGERVKVSGVCLKELYERLKRHLVVEVWAVEHNPLVEKVLPADQALVYSIEIQKPKEEQGVWGEFLEALKRAGEASGA
jgi:hypothetical protein